MKACAKSERRRDAHVRRAGVSLAFVGIFIACSSQETATLSLHTSDTEGTDDGVSSGTGGVQDEDGAGTGAEDGMGGLDPGGDGDLSPAPECAPGCPEEASHCLNGACVECALDSDCESDQMCEQSTGLCRRSCETTDDCEDAEFCSPSGVCLQCAIDADCSAEEAFRCSDQGRCVECLVSADCPEGDVCDISTLKCVECLSDDDCEVGTCDLLQRECSDD